MRMIRVLGLVVSFSLLAAGPGRAAEVSGRSSTQALWFTSDFNSRREVDIAEYLRLAINRIDQAGKFSLYGYGRGVQDVNNGNGLDGRLYYLYGEYRGLFDRIDIRVGREFVNLSAGTAIMDGAEVNLKGIGPIGITALGGRDVVFGLEGEVGHEGNYVAGVSAYLDGMRHTDLDVSWLRKWDAGDVSRDIIGVDFKQYLLDRFKVYGYGRYDITGEVFNEALGGVKYFPSENLVLTGEYYQSYPTFETTSIFSVFAVNRYWEAVFRASYTLDQAVEFHTGYNRQDYGDDETADVFEAGMNLRPVDSVVIDITYDHRNGYGGTLDGGNIDLLWDPLKALQLGIGMTVDYFDRNAYHDPREGQVVQRYWVGAKVRVASNMSASIRLDDDINERNTSYVQGRVVFNYDF